MKRIGVLSILFIVWSILLSLGVWGACFYTSLSISFLNTFIIINLTTVATVTALFVGIKTKKLFKKGE